MSDQPLPGALTPGSTFFGPAPALIRHVSYKVNRIFPPFFETLRQSVFRPFAEWDSGTFYAALFMVVQQECNSCTSIISTTYDEFCPKFSVIRGQNLQNHRRLFTQEFLVSLKCQLRLLSIGVPPWSFWCPSAANFAAPLSIGARRTTDYKRLRFARARRGSRRV